MGFLIGPSQPLIYRFIFHRRKSSGLTNDVNDGSIPLRPGPHVREYFWKQGFRINHLSTISDIISIHKTHLKTHISWPLTHTEHAQIVHSTRLLGYRKHSERGSEMWRLSPEASWIIYQQNIVSCSSCLFIIIIVLCLYVYKHPFVLTRMLRYHNTYSGFTFHNDATNSDEHASASSSPKFSKNCISEYPLPGRRFPNAQYSVTLNTI